MPSIDERSNSRPDENGQLDDGLTQVNPSIDEIVRRAQEALKRVSCNFDDWLDIAAAVVYLASDEAGYVTGQTLHANGGMAMI